MIVKRTIERGWLIVEVIVILLILCVLLHLLIDSGNGGYVSFVYAGRLSAKIPSATVGGGFLMVFLYWFVKGKFRQWFLRLFRVDV
jgi:hypothetical protein